MRTSRPVADKLGAVRQDPDLHGLLFILINRATGGRQERAARASHIYVTGEGRGLRGSRPGLTVTCRTVSNQGQECENKESRESTTPTSPYTTPFEFS